MDTETLSQIHHVYQQALQQQDWKAALDTLFVSLRGSFVFDNAALYLLDSKHNALEGAYARAGARQNRRSRSGLGRRNCQRSL